MCVHLRRWPFSPPVSSFSWASLRASEYLSSSSSVALSFFAATPAHLPAGELAGTGTGRGGCGRQRDPAREGCGCTEPEGQGQWERKETGRERDRVSHLCRAARARGTLAAVSSAARSCPLPCAAPPAPGPAQPPTPAAASPWPLCPPRAGGGGGRGAGGRHGPGVRHTHTTRAPGWLGPFSFGAPPSWGSRVLRVTSLLSRRLLIPPHRSRGRHHRGLSGLKATTWRCRNKWMAPDSAPAIHSLLSHLVLTKKNSVTVVPLPGTSLPQLKVLSPPVKVQKNFEHFRT